MANDEEKCGMGKDCPHWHSDYPNQCSKDAYGECQWPLVLNVQDLVKEAIDKIEQARTKDGPLEIEDSDYYIGEIECDLTSAESNLDSCIRGEDENE